MKQESGPVYAQSKFKLTSLYITKFWVCVLMKKGLWKIFKTDVYSSTFIAIQHVL